MSTNSETIELLVNLKVHRLIAVKKTLYRLADKFTGRIDAAEDERGDVRVTLMLRHGAPESERRAAELSFFRELTDQDLRERLSEETAAIRGVILAHAFSRTDLIRRG